MSQTFKRKKTCLVPIFIKKNETFWQGGTFCRELLFNTLKRLNSAFDYFHIITDDAEWIKNSNEVDQLIRYIDITNNFFIDDDILPRGSQTSLQVANRLNTDETVMVLDFRRANISLNDIYELEKKWAQDQSVIWTTLTSLVDHPCQAEQYFNCYQTGYIFLFSDIIRNGCYVSKPNHLPVPMRNHQKTAVSYWDARTLHTSFPECIHSLEEACRIPVVASSAGEDGMTQLFFPMKFIPKVFKKKDIIGSSLYYPPMYAVQENNQTRIVAPEICHLKSMGVDTILISFKNKGYCYQIPYEINKEIILPKKPEGKGIFIAFLEKVDSGKAEVILPFQTSKKMWIKNAYGLQHFPNGDLIYGRQNFPECYQLDASLSIGNVADLIRIKELCFQSKLRGHLTEWTYPKISTPLDYLYYYESKENV